MRATATILAALFASIAACGQESGAPATVTIVRPADGTVVGGDSVRVRLSASGVEIAPATGAAVSGEAHHHLFLDTDVTPDGDTIPKETEATGVKHLGTGDSAWTYRDLEPGRHRVIAVLADGAHIPLRPWAMDTTFFTIAQE